MAVEIARHTVTATKQAPGITATVAHSRNPKAAKPRRYQPSQWDDDVKGWFATAVDGAQVEVVVTVTGDGVAFLSLKNKPVLTPVTTPEGLPERLSQAGVGFVNPYTFVPTPPRAGLTADPGETGLGDCGDAGPPSHSWYRAGQWTGFLRLRLTTITPLLLPDTERVTPDRDDADRPCFTTRLDRDGLPLITGSALKGALRSAFETVTASRFGVFDGHSRRLAYRIPASQGLDVFPAEVEDGEEGRVIRLCRGDAAWQVPGGGGEVQAAAWVPAYKTQQHYLHLVGGLRGRLAAHHAKVLAARLRLYQYARTKNGKTTQFRVWRVTHLAPSLAALESALAGLQPVNDPLRPSSSLSLVKGVDPRTISGRLSVTGQSIGTKHDERFFAHTDSDVRVPLTAEHVTFWQSVLDAYTEASEYNTIPGDLVPSRHVDDAAALRDLPAGTPVYVTLDKPGGRTVTGVHPVMIGRMPFDLAPEDLLHPSLRPAADRTELSPADRLFGWVATKANPSKAGRRESSGYRGRLAVRSVRCTTKDWGPPAGFPEAGVILAPLSGPKPTQFRFYAAEDSTGKPLRPKETKDHGYRAEAGLRGRKAYRWPVVPDAYWEPSSDRQDESTVEGRYREYLDPRAPATQTARHRNWVGQAVAFEAELFLDGVPAAELGALLWLLDRGEKSPLRLGAAKPHGFGVLACVVDWKRTELWDGDALADGWRRLDRSDHADPADLTAMAEAFAGTAMKHPVLAEAVESYQAATRGVPKHAVHYPRETPIPEAESYKWFVANERTPRAGVVEGWALPHVRDTEQRLPYLPADRDLADGSRKNGRSPGGRNPGGRNPGGRRAGRPTSRAVTSQA
jgi:CRISPR-associated protein (TIGR03986 family)